MFFRKPTVSEILGVLVYISAMALLIVGAVLTYPGK